MSGKLSIARSFDCEEYYLQLHSRCGDILAQSFREDTSRRHSISHSYVLDLRKWVDILSQRPEVVLLEAALREYQFALLAIVQGQYRQAFMALRLFLELALSAICFSANEFELRLWLRGERDIYWEPLVNTDSGIFSKCFVRAFNEALVDEALHYGGIAKKLYRECSEYIHGGVHTYKDLPDALEFDEGAFLDWHEKAQSAQLVVSFTLCARYLQFLDETARNTLEPIITDELGHIEAIRIFFGGVTEVEQ